MNRNDRNAWNGLTSAQIQELDAAASHPDVMHLPLTEALRQVSNEYAVRAARLLTANDLRGALNAAEISQAAENVANRREDGLAQARIAVQRIKELAEQDERGELVYVDGSKRRKRVKRFPADGPSAI